jgi:predicted transcriptional regulator of viral defense system
MNKPSFPLNEAAVRALRGYGLPVLTDYQLGLVVYRLVREGRKGDADLRLQIKAPERRHYAQVLKFLVTLGVASPIAGFAEGAVFSLLGRDSPNPLAVLCTVDPFAYISHLSAMEYHGLTDRVPTTVYLTSPPSLEWRALAQTRMLKDLGDEADGYRTAGFPLLRRLRVTAIGKRAVHVTQRKSAGAFVVSEHGYLRVASIGRTFLEMVAEPDLCGGIRHVISVYAEHAATNRKLILAEVDRHGTAIDKVRAGYLLEEICSIRDPIVDHWQQTVVQRGGSRRLDAGAPYASMYSERWSLSLNHT